MQEVEHRGRHVIPAQLAGVVEGLLQDQGRYLPEADEALKRRDVVDGHPELAPEAAQVLVRQKEHQEGDPVSEEEPGPAEDQRRDQHQQQEPLGRDRYVEDEDHEERDDGQVAADQRRDEPGVPATYPWALWWVSRLHRKSLLRGG